jgi:hypothetical protein
MSTGGRPVARCTRAFTCSQNAAHAFCRSSKVAYCSSRFASVGTRSAFAMRTDASVPPFDWGSAGTQVRIVIP